ncbi:MAG: TIGR03790 family protein [Opitutaceae bacterium]
MKPLRVLLSVMACIAGSAALGGTAEEPQLRVVILANRADADSLRLAHHYAERRGVPQANVFAYPMSNAETITWSEFVSTVWEPLMEDLVRTSWIDAIPMDARDAVGRRKYATQGHRISYLVVCRGVPLRIAQDASIKEQAAPSPIAQDARIQTNQAAVDSELTILAMALHPAISCIPNPLFQNDAPTFLDEASLVKVSRLDGPTFESARALVDNAIEAEANGLAGRAYVDMGGPYAEADLWFLETEKMLAGTGFDFDVDRARGSIPAWGRFDAPVLYFGWYEADCSGPMAQSGFRFPPGAVAYHLHSNSAYTLRDMKKGWCGPLVARGVTATLGNVYEPYLLFTHRPQLFAHALIQGRRFGDAGFYALPALSWQGILIGDPLYRPFAKSFDAEWAKHGEMGSRLAAYIVLRKMHMLEAEGKNDAALELGRSEMIARPSLPLALGIATRLVSRQQGAEAARLLEFIRFHPASASEEWPLMQAAARIIAENGDKRSAFTIIDKLLENRAIQVDYRRLLLQDGIVWAKAAGNMQRMIQWQKDLLALGN